MNERRMWFAILGGGVLCAAGLSALIWWQHGQIEESRSKIATLHGSIDESRKLIEGSAALEREVIVLRELSEVMKAILPDTDDSNNLVRTLQRFSEDSGVRISGLKKKNTDAPSKSKSDFDRVAYTLSLEGDAFQLLEFFDLIEGHSRFMRVPAFRIQAATRSQLEKEGVPAHKVTLDVETFVYEPKKDEKAVRIDGYDRKRDLLLGEINRRKQSLSVTTYVYRGARGRRDPWIDPRVPAQPEGESALTVQEQMDVVQALVVRAQECSAKWAEINKEGELPVIVEMMMRQELEELLTALEADMRRVQAEKTVVYVPSERRFQSEVVDPMTELRTTLVQSEAGRGPSESALKEIEQTMLVHEARGEYKLMLEAFGAIENRLAMVEADPLRKPLVDSLRELAYEAQAVQDFEKIQLDFGGCVLIAGGDPVVMINGRSLVEGDVVGDEVVVRSIRPGEVEFVFRGVVFARRF